MHPAIALCVTEFDFNLDWKQTHAFRVCFSFIPEIF